MSTLVPGVFRIGFGCVGFGCVGFGSVGSAWDNLTQRRGDTEARRGALVTGEREETYGWRAAGSESRAELGCRRPATNGVRAATRREPRGSAFARPEPGNEILRPWRPTLWR